jgi:serine/threonine protein phosphatase Stp1
MAEREPGRSQVIWFRSCADTNAGPYRSLNEDIYVNRPELGLWAVADGAGGHQAGDVASAMIRDALDSIPSNLIADALLVEVHARLQDVHEALRREADERGANTLIASTVVVLLVYGSRYIGLWAGDSRIYLLRDAAICCLTEDHSHVQGLVNAGILAAEEAERHPQANVITRAVGAGEDPVVFDEIAGDVRPGDRFLLCSDGLSRTLTRQELAEYLLEDDGATPAEQLIRAAVVKQATDNVTAVVVEALD